MLLDHKFQPLQDDPSDSHAADLLAAFLVAWEQSIIAYEDLLERGIDRSDVLLAHDADYARLLNAGQRIRWLGGPRAVQSSARLMARQIPGGDFQHFGRLWSGLLPNDQA